MGLKNKSRRSVKPGIRSCSSSSESEAPTPFRVIPPRGGASCQSQATNPVLSRSARSVSGGGEAESLIVRVGSVPRSRAKDVATARNLIQRLRDHRQVCRRPIRGIHKRLAELDCQRGACQCPGDRHRLLTTISGIGVPMQEGILKSVRSMSSDNESGRPRIERKLEDAETKEFADAWPFAGLCLAGGCVQR